MRTVEAPPEGIAPDASFVPYKEFVWKDWMHAGDCVLKNMNAKYYKNGVITFSADARSEDTGDCWNPFKLNSYNGANAHLHETHNHPYCMQEKSKDFPVRWDDSYPEAFFNELQRVSARGSC